MYHASNAIRSEQQSTKGRIVETVKRPPKQKRRVTTRNVSLPPAYNTAIEVLAERAGHQNASRVIQDLIAREARAEIGHDWQIVISKPTKEREEAIAS
jgi:hypothetical protein